MKEVHPISRQSPAMMESTEVNITSRHQPAMPQRQKLIKNCFKFSVFINHSMDKSPAVPYMDFSFPELTAAPPFYKSGDSSLHICSFRRIHSLRLW